MNAVEILRNNNIRPSGLRIQILDYILSHRTHPSIEEIYEALLKDNPTLSKTTVYNTTKVLTENGLIKLITIDGQQTHYDGDTSLHGHFRCESCNKIYDFPISKLQQPELTGFDIHAMDVYYVGNCKHCNQK